MNSTEETTSEHGSSVETAAEQVAAQEVAVQDVPEQAAPTESDAASVSEPVSDETEAPAPFDLEKSVALLEALLLAHGEPIAVVKLQEIMKCSKEDFAAALAVLQERCAAPQHGVEVVQVASKLQLRTKAVFADQVRELMAVKPKKLSQAALETLAVIAYQQPVVKSEVDKIRGVDVAPTIKTLLERKLVKIIGYQASVGQPALYGTTEDFLKIFGLKSLSELPNLRDLKALAKDPGETGEDDDEVADSEVAEDESAASEAATEPSESAQPDAVA